MTHRELIGLALPVVHGRPFAHLYLPMPHQAWQMAEVALVGAGSASSLLEVCQISSQSLGPATPLPCGALAAMFPMVLLRQQFHSATELMQELAERSQPGATLQ